jgi:hypothetical protein
MAYCLGMPRPEFGPDDYENPDAPEAEQRLRADHPAVRDLSYDQGRARQYLDLWKQSLVEMALDPWEGTDPHDRHDAQPGPWLELFVKERPRGRGYVCDFVYREAGLPVAVHGTLVNEGHGLMVNELELWRGGVTGGWEYRDAWGDYVGPDADRDDANAKPYSGISSTLLRRIPLGRIVAAAQQTLAARSWETEGVQLLPGGLLAGHDIPPETRALLERTNHHAASRRRGRPPLADDLLEQVARAYLEEAPAGAGLTRRLAGRFGRPEPTVRDWVAAARDRGYLSAARPGRRGAAPGPRLEGRGAGENAEVR